MVRLPTSHVKPESHGKQQQGHSIRFESRTRHLVMADGEEMPVASTSALHKTEHAGASAQRTATSTS